MHMKCLQVESYDSPLWGWSIHINYLGLFHTGGLFLLPIYSFIQAFISISINSWIFILYWAVGKVL